MSTTNCDADLFTNALGKDQFGYARDKIPVRTTQQVASMNNKESNYIANTTTTSKRTTPTSRGGYQFYMSKDGHELHWFGEPSHDDTAVLGMKVDYQAPNAHERILRLPLDKVKRVCVELVQCVAHSEYCIAHVSAAQSWSVLVDSTSPRRHE